MEEEAAVDGAEVEEDDMKEEARELPEERELPEKEILRMWRSRGLHVLRRWLKLWPRTCMVVVVVVRGGVEATVLLCMRRRRGYCGVVRAL